MKKLLFFFLPLLIIAGCTQAQDQKKIENIPPYRILGPDSVYRTPANLKKNQPVMIVYFSPDCSHCQQMMYEMKEDMKPFSKIQIVMITFAPYKMVKEFNRNFDVAKYPNFTVGTEGYTYLVQKYYNIKNTPYIAIYNSRGKLYKAYDKMPKIKELAAVVKKV